MIGKQASGATWNQFPQVLGEPGVLWLSLQEWGPLTAPLFAAVPGCETCCLRPWGSGYLSSHCHHSCPHCLSAQCPFTTHFFLGHAASFTALTICDWPTLPSAHHLPLCALSSSLQAFAVAFKLPTPLYSLVQLSSFLVSVMSLLLANASRWTPFRLQKEHWKHRSVHQRAPQGEPQNQPPNPWHPSALCTFRQHAGI